MYNIFFRFLAIKLHESISIFIAKYTYIGINYNFFHKGTQADGLGKKLKKELGRE